MVSFVLVKLLDCDWDNEFNSSKNWDELGISTDNKEFSENDTEGISKDSAETVLSVGIVRVCISVEDIDDTSTSVVSNTARASRPEVSSTAVEVRVEVTPMTPSDDEEVSDLTTVELYTRFLTSNRSVVSIIELNVEELSYDTGDDSDDTGTDSPGIMLGEYEVEYTLTPLVCSLT